MGYIDSRGWEGDLTLEIYTPIRDGNLADLVHKKNLSGFNSTANTVLSQMLAALDFLASVGIVHRDVKPENILFSRISSGRYKFQLANFGLANSFVYKVAHTDCGTDRFKSPEIFNHCIQNHKTDVWSLYVAIVWMMDVNGFRNANFANEKSLYKIFLHAADTHKALERLRPMAIYDPEYRASATMVLKNLYHGRHMTTPLCDVPNISPTLWNDWCKHAMSYDNLFSKQVGAMISR